VFADALHGLLDAALLEWMFGHRVHIAYSGPSQLRKSKHALVKQNTFLHVSVASMD